MVKLKKRINITPFLQQISEFIANKLDDEIQIQNFSFDKNKRLVF